MGGGVVARECPVTGPRMTHGGGKDGPGTGARIRSGKMGGTKTREAMVYGPGGFAGRGGQKKGAPRNSV